MFFIYIYTVYVVNLPKIALFLVECSTDLVREVCSQKTTEGCTLHSLNFHNVTFVRSIYQWARGGAVIQT